MKRSLCAVALAVLLCAPSPSAEAAQLNTFALVDIIDNIAIVQDTPLDFGGLVRNDGSVTVSPAGVVTDPNTIVAATTQTPGEFTITSIVGAQLEITFTTSAFPVNGLQLSAFQWDIGGSSSTPHDVLATNEVLMLGATLTVTGLDALVGLDQQIPYTITVQFP